MQSFQSLATVANYDPMRDEATEAGLQQRIKQSVLGQFGPNSDEIQSLGYKRKSLRKPNRRPSSEQASADEDQ